MAEYHDRCRYWPNCIIHLGDDRPKLLSHDLVREIRARRAAGEMIVDIARDLHVGTQTVGGIVRGCSYRNVGGGVQLHK